MRNFQLTEEVLGYVTAENPTNTDPRNLVAGSQNVLIDRQRKVYSRGGYSRLGAANAAVTPVRHGPTWNTSTGTELPIRFYDDEMEAYFTSVDGTTINAWTRVANSWSTTLTPRSATWYDATEALDLFLFIFGDHNIYEWSGGVAVVDSLTGTTVTKTGTTTFAQNRFYTSRDKTVICVRTGTEYTYTGGAGTTTITGISDTTGLVAGDVLIQKIVTNSNKPASGRVNDTILVFENQLCLGSFIDNLVYISKNDDYADFAYSAPRTAGQGGLLTLDGPSGGLGFLSSKLIAFAGRSSIFTADFEQITVGTTLAETIKVKKLKSGVDQGCQAPDSIVMTGDSILYLTYEPALRTLDDASLNDKPTLKTLSNPIKPDFDNETWTNAQAIWHKNAYKLCAPASSKLLILEFVEDADGKLRRFWQPPQILPVGWLTVISDALHGHSSAIAETYKLFDGYSDINSDDEKLPIYAIAKFAYQNFNKRGLLKNFDEYMVEGEITPGTNDLLLDLNYDWGGHGQVLEQTVDGTDESILLDEVVGSSLGQVPLGQHPFGSSGDIPVDAMKFRVIFEMARDDFNEIQAVFSTNEIDRYWAILSHGPNAVVSNRKLINIKQ